MALARITRVNGANGQRTTSLIFPCVLVSAQSLMVCADSGFPKSTPASFARKKFWLSETNPGFKWNPSLYQIALARFKITLVCEFRD